jgi:hypothetical protein
MWLTLYGQPTREGSDVGTKYSEKNAPGEYALSRTQKGQNGTGALNGHVNWVSQGLAPLWQ